MTCTTIITLLMALFMSMPALGERSEQTAAGLRDEVIYPEHEVGKSLDDLVEQVYRISIITCMAARPKAECEAAMAPEPGSKRSSARSVSESQELRQFSNATNLSKRQAGQDPNL